MKSFWQNEDIVWSEGIKEMHLVIKDNSGGSGHAHKRQDSEKFFPTKMRITMVQVSAGSTYDPKQVPNTPPPVGADGGKPRDSAAPKGTGAALEVPAGASVKTTAEAEECGGCGESE
jgi:hypothetical protein